MKTTLFSAIKKNFTETAFVSDEAIVANGDSLELLKRLPSNSISLILTDPPYHSTKKKNIFGDSSFTNDEEYISWMELFFIEWKRVLKSNGSVFCFCSTAMSAQLEIKMAKNLNVLSHIVWTKPNQPGFDGWKGKMNKESLRQWYAHSERILFAEASDSSNLFKSPFATLLKNSRLQAGLSMHQLTAIVGAHGKINHGGAVSNWECGRNTPSREQYEKIRNAILITGKVELMPLYEDAIRPFIIDGSKQFTDVWDFPSVKQYKGKHPAEKPLELLKHAIHATTYEEDIVLDCFAGSGNTALAALSLGRKSISFEIEKKWTDSISNKLLKQNGFSKKTSSINANVVTQSASALFTEKPNDIFLDNTLCIQASDSFIPESFTTTLQ